MERQNLQASMSTPQQRWNDTPNSPMEETSVLGLIINDLFDDDDNTYYPDRLVAPGVIDPMAPRARSDKFIPSLGGGGSNINQRPALRHRVCAFFTSEKGCARQQCPFVHDFTAPTSITLKPCPNADCSNMCIGKQCQACHLHMMGKSAHRSEIDQPRPGTRVIR